MKKILFIATAIILLLSNSCKKDEIASDSEIVGRWAWLNTVNPWTGTVSNPETASYTVTLEFSEAGILKEYRNSTLFSSDSYSTESNSQGSDYHLLKTDSSSIPYFIEDNILSLKSEHTDGPVTRYIRMR